MAFRIPPDAPWGGDVPSLFTLRDVFCACRPPFWHVGRVSVLQGQQEHEACVSFQSVGMQATASTKYWHLGPVDLYNELKEEL